MGFQNPFIGDSSKDVAAREVVVVRPGDTVIMEVGSQVSQEVGDRLRAQLEAKVPGVTVAVISGLSPMMVYRPDAPAEAL